MTSTSFIMYTHTHTYITVFVSIHGSQPVGLHSYRYIAASLRAFSITRVLNCFVGCYVTKNLIKVKRRTSKQSYITEQTSVNPPWLESDLQPDFTIQRTGV